MDITRQIKSLCRIGINACINKGADVQASQFSHGTADMYLLYSVAHLIPNECDII